MIRLLAVLVFVGGASPQPATKAPGEQPLTLAQNRAVAPARGPAPAREIARLPDSPELVTAVADGKIERVRALLTKNVANPSSLYQGEIPVVSLAIVRHEYEIAKVLAESGANLDDPARGYNGGQTPLGFAVAAKQLDLVQLFVAKGANVNAPGKLGDRPLAIAAQSCQTDVFRTLLDAGAKVNQVNDDGSPAITYAATCDEPELVALLLRHHADIAGNVREQTSAIFTAAHAGKPDIVRLLIGAGANVNQAEQRHGDTPLMRSAQNGHREVVQLLLQARAEVNAANKRGETALSMAATNDHSQVVELLLAAGADAGIKDRLGATALMHATANGARDAVRVLSAKGGTIADRDRARVRAQVIERWEKRLGDKRCEVFRYKASATFDREICVIDEPPARGGRGFTLSLFDPNRTERKHTEGGLEDVNLAVSTQPLVLEAGDFVDVPAVAIERLSEEFYLVFVPVVHGLPDQFDALGALLFVGKMKDRKPAVAWRSPTCSGCTSQTLQIQYRPGTPERQLLYITEKDGARHTQELRWTGSRLLVP